MLQHIDRLSCCYTNDKEYPQWNTAYQNITYVQVSKSRLKFLIYYHNRTCSKWSQQCIYDLTTVSRHQSYFSWEIILVFILFLQKNLYYYIILVFSSNNNSSFYLVLGPKFKFLHYMYIVHRFLDLHNFSSIHYILHNVLRAQKLTIIQSSVIHSSMSSHKLAVKSQ